MRTIKILAGVFLYSLLLVGIGKAQPTAGTATEQQQGAQRVMDQQQTMNALRTGTNAPEIYEGENADIGPQHVLRLVPRRTYFEVRADSEYLYSDNPLLTKQFFRRPGTIFVNTLNVAFAPPAYRLGEGRLSPTIGVQSQWYNFGLGGPSLKAFDLDFEAQTAFV